MVATRPILPQERTQLAREMWRLRVTGWVLGSLAPLIFLGAIGAMVVTTDADIHCVLTQLIYLLIIVVPALGLMIANRSLVRANGIRDDLRQGHWLRFEGVYTRDDGTEMPAPVHRVLAEYLGHTICLDVLPASARLWRINETPVRRWVMVTLTETADQPEIADIAAQWLDPIGETDNMNLAAGSRELSDTEKDEIRRHIRHCWQTPLLPTLVLVPWAATLCWFALETSATLPQGRNNFMFVLLIIFAGVALYRQVRGVHKALQLRKDAHAGIVIIVSATPTADNATNPETTLVEMLPHANLPWTEQGAPAGWRHI